MKDYKKMIIWVLFWLLCIFQILDIWQTHLLLETGAAYEANPILNFFIPIIGFWATEIIAKTLVMGFLAFVVHKCLNA